MAKIRITEDQLSRVVEAMISDNENGEETQDGEEMVLPGLATEENLEEGARWLEKIKKIFQGKSQEEKEAEALKIIMAHPGKRAGYLKAKKEDPDKAQKYIEAVASDPEIKYWGWDAKERKWYQTGKFSAGGHVFGSGE